MVLYELYTSREVSLIELIGYIPTQWPILPPLLYCSVEEGHCIKDWLPLGQVTDVKLFLTYASIRPLETSFNTLRRLVSKLYTGLLNNNI